MANHEAPIPNNAVYHRSGTIFATMPKWIPAFRDAGIDFFTLANNHIKDAGTDGIVDTRANLDRVGIKHVGAGKDLKQASQPAYLTVRGTKVGIVGCVAVAPFSWATASSGGGMPCKPKTTVPAVKEARKRADLVIVFAHWGVEYSREPNKEQREYARAWMDAGADLVLGAHSHVAGAIEQIDGRMVFYSLGNFIFDQNWSTATMESVLLELTFQGDRLVQFRLHPFITHLQSQPNFLNPASDDGKDLLAQIRKASFIDW
jgi:poly-gamma-glutamate synthesis protein (capsule biosynthesis protein)